MFFMPYKIIIISLNECTWIKVAILSHAPSLLLFKLRITLNLFYHQFIYFNSFFPFSFFLFYKYCIKFCHMCYILVVAYMHMHHVLSFIAVYSFIWFKNIKKVYSIIFFSYFRGNKCLFKRKYTPKHDTTFSTCNSGQTNEVTTIPLTNANLKRFIFNKFNNKHSTRLDMQTELQTYVINFLCF